MPKTLEEMENDAYMAGDVERADMLRTMIKMERELNDAEYQLEQYRKCFGED